MKPHEKKKLETFDQRIDFMQWLILYSHQNDNVLNDNYCAESKNVEVPVDQIGQNTKNELPQHKISHTQYLRRASRH